MIRYVKQCSALVVLALVGSGGYAGIANTKHNLTSTGPGPNKTTSTDQICVFCHTPHGADTSASVPLWNKKLPANTYQTYKDLNTSTLNGEILPVGSVSLACLSCHDGTQAMDNIINAPGSGGFDVTGGGITGLNFTWSNGADTLTGTPIPNLGTDLRNDHPIGIEYCGGGLNGTATTVSGTCKNPDFVQASVQTKTVNGNQVFWVDTVPGTPGVREKTDISLYTRTFTGTGQPGPAVECASCHDPHVETKGSDNLHFMRVTLAGSQICLSCHVK
jgi:hypothetical protein